jgi:phage FluMu protein Com
MEATRCANCNRHLMAMTDRTGHTELRCLKCDKIDPMKTDATNWAKSPLATGPLRPAGASR